MRRKLIVAGLLFSVLVAAAAVVFYFRGNVFDPMDRGKWPVSGEYTGLTKESIVERYGPPAREWEGPYGLPPPEYIKQHSPMITIVYERWTGTLYLSLDKKRGEWICFRSDWVPVGCVID
jgi:hypothetical protein